MFKNTYFEEHVGAAASEGNHIIGYSHDGSSKPSTTVLAEGYLWRNNWGGGGKSRTTGGFGEAPKIFRFVWVVESLNHPLLFGTNTKDMPHMKFIFVETDDEY